MKGNITRNEVIHHVKDPRGWRYTIEGWTGVCCSVFKKLGHFELPKYAFIPNLLLNFCETKTLLIFSYFVSFRAKLTQV